MFTIQSAKIQNQNSDRYNTLSRAGSPVPRKSK
jgi:hypothetical protein